MRNRVALSLGISIGLLAGGAASANPQGPSVAHGQASFARPSSGQLDVTTTPNAIINWSSFSIAPQETTRFLQQSASSAVLNRVVGGGMSDIQGRLQSNGRVFLINPHGVVFGPNAVVDTAGLVASSLGITDADFLAGRLRFDAGPNAGAVVNRGYLRAGAGGEVVLLAPDIENSGLIRADGGRLLLAAGRSITLASLGGGDVEVEVRAPEDEVLNLGDLIARGGAVEVLASTIRSSGLVSADSVHVGEDGRVELRASRDVVLAPGSRTVASSSVGSDGGRVDIAAGGFVALQGETRADGERGGAVTVRADRVLATGATSADGSAGGGTVSVQATGRVLATAEASFSARGGVADGGTVDVRAGGAHYTSAAHDASGARGGEVRILGDDVAVAGARASASGPLGGGRVLVGAGRSGGEGLPVASRTRVSAATELAADATVRGDGGEVVVYGLDAVHLEGAVSARGGALSGDGGLIELSSHGEMVNLATLDLDAPAGTDGTFLIDPRQIVLQPGGGGGGAIGAGVVGILDPNPGAGDQFGADTQSFFPDRLVVLDPNDDLAGTDSGAVYMFDVTTGALESALVGGQAGDRIGENGLLFVSGGYYVSSPSFGGGRGALTFGTQSSLPSGVVSATNSLVGAGAGDAVGSGGFTFISGSSNFLISSPEFGGQAGALTLATPGVGLTGVVSTSNSLVGANPGDRLGSGGIVQLFQGDALVLSPQFASGAGAVTLYDGATGLTGVVGSGNSLVGAAAGDQVGSGGTSTLGNFGSGRYMVRSPLFGGGRGAVSFGDAAGGGVSGVVSAANSLVGASAGDGLGGGSEVTINSSTGDRLLRTAAFDGNRGAITFFSGTAGRTGTLGAANSLVGPAPGADLVGNSSIQVLGSGNYVVSAPGLDLGAAVDAGAVSFGDVSAGGAVGVVSAANSLVGTATGDRIGGSGVQDLSGVYAVLSPDFSGGTGAVTIADSDAGVSGAVSSANSLVGAAAGDRVGSGGLREIDFGATYAVFSPEFGGAGVAADALGGVTVFGIASAPIGVVSSANSLVGGQAGDRVGNGGLDRLDFSGTGVIRSRDFASGAGALTFVSGVAPFPVGVVDATNSLVGSAPGDSIGNSLLSSIGSSGVFAARSVAFGGGAGAVTTFDSATGSGLVGTVSATTSLVGAAPGDSVGNVIRTLDSSSGDYLVLSQSFQGGTGAITFVPGATGRTGVVDATNSLVGADVGDAVGTSFNVTVLGNGNYVVRIPTFDNAGLVDAGAIVFGDSAAGGAVGVVSSANAIVGGAAGDRVGSGVILDLGDIFSVASPFYGSAGGPSSAAKGAITFGDSSTGIPSGAIGGTNSLVGAVAGDQVGSSGIFQIGGSGNFLVRSPQYDGGAGAVTFVDGLLGVRGIVSATNSLVGAAPGDGVGSSTPQFVDFSSSDSVLVTSGFGGGRGAVTFIPAATGITGVVGATNSLVGAAAGDAVGSGGIDTLGTGDYLVQSPLFSGGRGAVTVGDPGAGGARGVVSTANSLVGATTADAIGSGQVREFGGGTYVYGSPGALGGRGAVTFGDASGLPTGTVGAANSLVGATVGDAVGASISSNIFFLSGDALALRTPGFGAGAGAMTFGSRSAGFGTGTMSSANSLVGANPGDSVGSSGFSFLTSTEALLQSPLFNAGAGASTLIADVTVGLTGVVGAGNSLVGANAGDGVGSVSPAFLPNGRVALRAPNFDGGRGAVTVGTIGAMPVGIVSTANSLVGASAGDRIGDSVSTNFLTGEYVVRSTTFGGGRGSVTVGSVDAPTVGVVSSANSLVGSAAGDSIGSGGVQNLSNGNYAVISPQWNGGRGAVTILTDATGNAGVVSGLNSHVGEAAGDGVGSFGAQTLSTGDLLVRAPFADRGGLVDAGRIDIVSAAGVTSDVGNISFADRSGETVTLGVGTIASFLASGAGLVLQVNNDILIDAGADIIGAGTGGLTLQAGRSVVIEGDIVVAGPLVIIANDVGAPGINPAERDVGPGDVEIRASIVQGSTVQIAGSNVLIQGGSAAAVVSTDGPIDIVAGTPLLPGTLTLVAGASEDSDALIVAQDGDGIVNLAYGACIGCETLGTSSEQFLFDAPLENALSDVGIYASQVTALFFPGIGAGEGGLDLEEAIRVIIATTENGATDSESEEEREELARADEEKSEDESGQDATRQCS
ncbi:MAG: filamentous hemagglutinin N-terminal domain-containing protein [Chromatiales bacterium]|nr:filamentous hemagglutinin N-terminal domain-containing protein [Chromatiales bacterium]